MFNFDFNKLFSILKDEKFLLVLLVVFAITIAYFSTSCSTYSNVTSIDSLKVYNLKHDVNLSK